MKIGYNTLYKLNIREAPFMHLAVLFGSLELKRLMRLIILHF